MLPDLMLTAALLLLALEDLRHREIPMWAPPGLLFAGLLLPLLLPNLSLALYGELHPLASSLPNRLLPFLPGCLLTLMSIISHGGIGLGDGLLVLSLGSWLSLFQMICFLMGGLLCAFIPAVILFFRHHSAKAAFPFLPPLVISWSLGLLLSAGVL